MCRKFKLHVLVAIMVAALGVAGSMATGGPAGASTNPALIGQYPPSYCDAGSSYVLLSNGNYAATVRFGSGPVLGYLHLRRSPGCQTVWSSSAIVNPGAYTMAVSIWHPGQGSIVDYLSASPIFQYGRMLDVRSGAQTCIGAQVYVRNGPWIGWFFGGCWTG
jgi:hypothetical protein